MLLPSHPMYLLVQALKYTPNGERLAAGSHDNYIYIYDSTRG